jgi:hypothetical protein
MKVELKGHEFDLDALVHLFPSGPIRMVRENGVHYLLADDIDNRPQGVQYYEVAPKILKTVNGLARVTDSAYQPVELSGYYFEGEQRHVVVSAETVVTRVRVGKPTVLVTNSEGIVQAPPPPRSSTRSGGSRIPRRDRSAHPHEPAGRARMDRALQGLRSRARLGHAEHVGQQRPRERA